MRACAAGHEELAMDVVTQKHRRDAFAKAQAKMIALRADVIRATRDSESYESGMLAIRETSIEALDTFASLIDDLERTEVLSPRRAVAMAEESKKDTEPVTEAEVKAIADLAYADERSVWKRLGGGQLRPKVQARVDRAIAERIGARG